MTHYCSFNYFFHLYTSTQLKPYLLPICSKICQLHFNLMHCCSSGRLGGFSFTNEVKIKQYSFRSLTYLTEKGRTQHPFCYCFSIRGHFAPLPQRIFGNAQGHFCCYYWYDATEIKWKEVGMLLNILQCTVQHPISQLKKNLNSAETEKPV